MNLLRNKEEYIKFGNYTYRLHLEKLKELCLTASKEGGGKEIQIAQTYEVDENDELSLISKVEHETKSIGNNQNDMIIYDIFKLLLVTLLEDDRTTENYKPTFNTTLAINSLLSWGILEKL